MSSRGCCRPTIAQFARLRSQCLRWSEDHAAELKGADPSLPKALDDRAADNWRPLKAIADVLGDRWSKLCSDAAEVLSRERGEDETTGVALLLALKAIFAEHAAGDLRPAGQAGRQGDAHGSHPAEAARRRLPLEGIRTRAEKPITDTWSRPAAEGVSDQAGLVTGSAGRRSAAIASPTSMTPSPATAPPPAATFAARANAPTIRS